MGVWDYKSLREHVGHNLECVVYGDEVNVAIECTDCSAVLLDYDSPEQVKEKEVKRRKQRHSGSPENKTAKLDCRLYLKSSKRTR